MVCGLCAGQGRGKGVYGRVFAGEGMMCRRKIELDGRDRAGIGTDGDEGRVTHRGGGTKYNVDK